MQQSPSKPRPLVRRWMKSIPWSFLAKRWVFGKSPCWFLSILRTSSYLVHGTWMYLVPLCQSRNHCAAGCVPSPWLKASHLIDLNRTDWTASPWWEADRNRRLLLRSSGGTTQVQLVGRVWGSLGCLGSQSICRSQNRRATSTDSPPQGT